MSEGVHNLLLKDDLDPNFLMWIIVIIYACKIDRIEYTIDE